MNGTLGKGILAGAVQGSAASVAMFNYTHAGELGTLGWLSCLIFIGTFFFIGILKSIDKKVREKVAMVVTTNMILSTYMVEKELLEDFKEFATNLGMDTRLEQVPTDEM
jgi:hypothetical protein